MAAARQKEMKDSMTVVATTTFTVAERCSDGTKGFSRITHKTGILNLACKVG
jgi:hypothetical protein